MLQNIWHTFYHLYVSCIWKCAVIISNDNKTEIKYWNSKEIPLYPV